VYELASDFEQPLKRFESSREVLRQFERQHSNGSVWHRVDLQVYVLGAGPPFSARRRTVLREFAHRTLSHSRLTREFRRRRFGDEGYATEELVAEFGAAFLCTA
jgi:hypothetical protein